MAAPERPSEPGVTGHGEPPAGFFAELSEVFRRHRPQGSARWNFSDAFGRLEALFGAGRPASADRPPPAVTLSRTPDASGPPTSFAHRVFDRTVADRLQRWIDERAAEAARGAAEEALGEGLASVAGGFDATIEAFRFLAARVEGLEDSAAARRAPIDGLAWLVPPPDLVGWADPVSRWVAAHRAEGVIVHGECGDGSLTAALAGLGLAVRGAEPRGAVAWDAAGLGVDVHVGPVGELLDSVGPGSLGGLVLSGVVDRLALEDLVALLETATDRLGEGAGLVVVSTSPDVAATGRDAVARDLVPGRPLHPETWALLLGRAGYEEVGPLAAPEGSPTYAVTGRRPG
ncbi:MAG: hypothetical protein ACLP62_14465 [Acidimicrobiales bacterium]